MIAEIFDTIFVIERVCASVILLLSAVYVWYMIRLHKGGIMQKPWIVLLSGILVFAVAQLVSASSAVLGSYPIRIVGGALQLIGSLSILVGLLRLVGAWRNFRIP
jgi:hypothetical protein